MPFHFDSKVYYERRQFVPGEVENLSPADADNLHKGGSGHPEELCPGNCAAVKAGNARPAEEASDAPDVPATEPQNPGGEGSNDAPPPPPDPQSNTLTCDVCGDGRVFATAAGLASHRSQKH